jgi:hypothetical protein
MKKLLIVTIAAVVLLLSFSVASANWEYQFPSDALVIAYFNATPGFQTFIMISQQDTDTFFGQSVENPNVVVKFNPKCGRGESRSFTLTTKQSLVVTPPQPIEGWVEVFVKSAIEDESAGGIFPLSGVAVILDIGNGVAYNIKSINYFYSLCLNSSDEPLFYGSTCDASSVFPVSWGGEEISGLIYPIVADLWRHSDYGRTMFVLCDPSGRHIANAIPDPTPAIGWNPSALYIPNKAQLDLYSKSETDAHLSVEWCTGDDAGKPGIVTIGVGTTDGPLGTTDTMINNPAATSLDAPYGFAEAYNLRILTWVDVNQDGLMTDDATIDSTLPPFSPYEENTMINTLLGAVLTRISNDYFPHAIHAKEMVVEF